MERIRETIEGYIRKYQKRHKNTPAQNKGKSSIGKYEENHCYMGEAEIFDECDLEIYEILNNIPRSKRVLI